MDFITRIQKVTISNLKNVGYGEIRFTCNTRENIFEAGSDILGMYGQNGSGKTTLIFALEILSQLTSGKNYGRMQISLSKLVLQRQQYVMSLV